LRQARLQDVSAGGDARARDHRGGLGARQRILPGSGRRETAAVLLRQGRRSARPGVREARGAGMRSPLLAIFLVVVVDILGLTIMLPLLPFYAEHFGASPAVIGIAFGIGCLIGPGASGYLTSHFGYHIPILCAAALSLLSILGTTLLLPAVPAHPEGMQSATAQQELEAPIAPGGKRLRILD